MTASIHDMPPAALAAYMSGLEQANDEFDCCFPEDEPVCPSCKGEGYVETYGGFRNCPDCGPEAAEYD